MRGKVERNSDIFNGVGITPAYAGKSLCFEGFRFPVEDHPRICGEK